MGWTRRSPRSLGGLLTVISALAFAPVPAQAAPKPREQREAEARRACAAGRVEAGIEILAELLTEFSHPNYIYNQGRCYQQNGKAEQAIVRFKEYLRAAQNITPEERVRVQRFIEELDAELQAAAPAAATPPTATGAVAAPPPASGEGAVRSATEAVPGADVSRTEVPPPQQSRTRGGGLRTAAIALGVAGGVGLGTGIVSGLQVRSLSNEVNDADAGRFNTVTLAQQQEKAQRFETLQWIGYGVGAAAVAGAVICVMMDSNRAASESARRAILIGTVGPDGQPGLMLAGRFP